MFVAPLDATGDDVATITRDGLLPELGEGDDDADNTEEEEEDVADEVVEVAVVASGEKGTAEDEEAGSAPGGDSTDAWEGVWSSG
jgi:hypothetical protein